MLSTGQKHQRGRRSIAYSFRKQPMFLMLESLIKWTKKIDRGTAEGVPTAEIWPMTNIPKQTHDKIEMWMSQPNNQPTHKWKSDKIFYMQTEEVCRRNDLQIYFVYVGSWWLQSTFWKLTVHHDGNINKREVTSNKEQHLSSTPWWTPNKRNLQVECQDPIKNLWNQFKITANPTGNLPEERYSELPRLSA